MIKLEHLNFGFKRTDIEHQTQKAFTKLNIEQNLTPFFQTLNELERIHLLVIKLEHLNFGFEQMDIQH